MALLDPLTNVFNILSGMGIIGFGNSGYASDRVHTEEREDTAVQRRVEDMRKAGINPYTIGASAASSTASSVGSQNAAYNLQMLGYILDLQNLNAKNRKITNDLIGDVLGFFKK